MRKLHKINNNFDQTQRNSWMEIDKRWHLAETDDEIKVADFELQLWRVYYGFRRWQEECEKIANGTELSSDELAILHVIRMKDRPKSVYDIGRLLNRDDPFNIQYNIRKLLEMGFIDKTPSASNKKQLLYFATPEGIKNTDTYVQARRNILITEFSKEMATIDLEEVTRVLTKLKAVYDEALRAAASYETVNKKG